MKNQKQIKWLCQRTGAKMYGKLAVLTLLGMLMSYLGVRFAIVSKEVLDIASHAKEGSLYGQIAHLLVMLLLLLGSQVVYSLMNARVSGKYAIRLKEYVFGVCLGRDWQQISNIHSGELINLIHSDVNVIVTGVMLLIPNLVSLLFRIVLSFYELFRLDKWFALVCLLLCPMIFFGILPKTISI